MSTDKAVSFSDQKHSINTPLRGGLSEEDTDIVSKL